MELLRNPIGLRYFLCLLFLWAIHGYVYYGISHHIYKETYKHHIFVCITDALSNLLGLVLCRWTGQKRAVVSSLLMLSAFCCFGLAILESMSGEDDVDHIISTVSQVVSFLITCSWNIVWLLSAELIGRGARWGKLHLKKYFSALGSGVA